MKKQFVIFVIALLLSGITLVYGKANKNPENIRISQKAVNNYLVGLKSENLGIRLSCAYFAGEYKIEDAVIPLMKMLHSEKTEEARIMAALALAKIGTGKCLFAIKQTALFDKSQRVRSLCTKFYNSVTAENSGLIPIM